MRLSIKFTRAEGVSEAAFINTKCAEIVHNVNIHANAKPKSKKLNILRTFDDFGLMCSP